MGDRGEHEVRRRIPQLLVVLGFFSFRFISCRFCLPKPIPLFGDAIAERVLPSTESRDARPPFARRYALRPAWNYFRGFSVRRFLQGYVRSGGLLRFGGEKMHEFWPESCALVRACFE